MRFLEEFKQFAARGRVIDLAVGIIIGTAFNKITNSLVADIIMPPLGLVINEVSFTSLKILLKPAEVDANGRVSEEAVTINYGNFLQNVFDFLIIAFAVFLLIRFINSLKRRNDEEKIAEKQKALSKQEQLLVEIRDVLKALPEEIRR